MTTEGAGAVAEATAEEVAAPSPLTYPAPEKIYRHTFLVRLTHWINALTIFLMIGSGLNIFNAHPRLFWGETGSELDHPFLSIASTMTSHGIRGLTTIGSLHFDTTGFLGWSKVGNDWAARAWPSWITVPSYQDLADARHWHFFFAWVLVTNGAIYLIWSLLVRHVQRDLWPTWRDIKSIPRSVLDHVRLKHPRGEAAKRYNVLQRLAYLGLIGLVVGMVATGLTMSPGFDAFAPWLLDLFGGRQSARALHFIFASLITAFIVVHLIEVVLAGPVNEIRSDDYRTLRGSSGALTAMALISRREALIGSLGGGLLLSGCAKLTGADALTDSQSFRHVMASAQDWTMASQRLLLSSAPMAREFTLGELSPHFKANGTLHPGGDEYSRHLAGNFVDWRLQIGGMVSRPLSLSISDIARLPSRTQITRHDCVEGWSAIGQWKGVQLGLLLKAANVLPGARYAVLFCADNLEGEPAKGGAQSPGQYYESIDLVDARHPQTLIAYEMNSRPLDVAHGAPLRLRVERQLGYKQAKYVQRIALVSTLAGIGRGRGGYWEDRGYEWYAGI